MLKTKAKYHHGDLRRALVEASLGIIGRDGAEALSLRNVAREAGVSHAAPYAHFEDKEDLIEAVKDEGFRELHAELVTKLADSAQLPPVERLRALGEVYLRFASTQSAKYHIMFRRPLLRAPKPTAVYVEKGREIFALLAQEVRAMPGARRFPPHLVVMTAWSTLHGLCSLWNDGPLSHIVPEGTAFDELAGQFVDYIAAQLERV